MAGQLVNRLREGGAVIEGGWYTQARRVPSPNYSARPDADDISLLVIHNISLPPGEFGGDAVERFFLNTLSADEHPYYADIVPMKVSAHCYVRREGDVIQFVPFHFCAWHAGESCFGGRKSCNDYAIGIELEGTDMEPYTELQYRALTLLTQSLLKTYSRLSVERISGHSTIAPGRKTDPGPAFNWEYYTSLVENN